MIRSQEIKEKAREYGVPTSTIERDYAQNWLLKYLYHPNIVLKGGTGIKKAYHENYRFSDDLDFSLIHPIKDKELLTHMNEAVDNAKEIDKKFDFKGVILDISSLTKRKDDFSNAWDASLRHQLKVIPDLKYLVTITSEIKT